MRRQCCWTTDLPSNKNAYWLIFKSNMSRTVQQICWTTETVVQQSDARICCTTKIPLYNKTVQQKLSNKNTNKSVVQQQKLSNKYETVQQIGNCTTNTVQQIWNCPTKRLTKTVQPIQAPGPSGGWNWYIRSGPGNNYGHYWCANPFYWRTPTGSWKAEEDL